MASFRWSRFMNRSFIRGKSVNRRRSTRSRDSNPGLGFEPLEGRLMMSGPGDTNLNEIVDTTLTPTQLAESLVGTGVSVSNVAFTGADGSTGGFNFVDPTVVGFGQGIVLSSGSAAYVTGPNVSDSTSTDFAAAGDADLDALSGFTTFDAAVLEFDFIPTANQVVFYYAFASDEYPEWVNTPFNDVFAFFVNGTNYAVVRQVAGDPSSPFVPVAVNNINDSNPVQDPPPISMRPDLFRANYYDFNGPSLIDLEQDGITSVLTFQAPVVPGELNHMKLAIADASDGIYDSAVFIQAGSLVSDENPVADLSLSPSYGAAPLLVTAFVEGEDPNGLAISYTIDWGDGTTSSGPLDQPTDDAEKTAQVDHIYTAGGTYFVTLTVSNGTLFGTSIEDVDVAGVNAAPIVTSQPTDQSVFAGDLFTFAADADGFPTPEVQWQVSTDGGMTFVDIDGANETMYSSVASETDNGSQYRAVFTNSEGEAITDVVTLTVSVQDVTPPVAPGVALTEDTGSSASDNLSKIGTLILSAIEADAWVEYSIDNGIVWTPSFLATEGLNTVQVRQTDLAGNVSNATTFGFTLDTTAPGLSPVFSSASPFLVGATGITLIANATDAFGIASVVSGTIDTSTPGNKLVSCTATDNAGNSYSVDVPYVVGYGVINAKPTAGATFKRTASIPVSFQLIDATGLISDQTAASLLSSISVQFAGQPSVAVKYNKKTKTFSVTLKTGRPAVGAYSVTIRINIGGSDVTTWTIPVNIV